MSAAFAAAFPVSISADDCRHRATLIERRGLGRAVTGE